MKINDFLKSKKYKEKIKPEIKRTSAVIFFTLIYSIGVKWFLEASVIKMFTGGIPGLAQVLKEIFVNLKIIDNNIGDIFMSFFIIIINIPILILGWFGVSKRFTIYSLISVLIQSTIIGFLPIINLGLGKEQFAIIAAILGGLFIGIGIGGTLKFGTSTGGFDIISQYWSLKKGKTVGFISMFFNLSIAVVGSFVASSSEISVGIIFSYTLIRIIVTTIATDKVHTSYHYLSIEIITENPHKMVEAILHNIHRGVTLTKVEGAYSHHEKTLVMVVIATYELQFVVDIIKEVDCKSFVVAKPVKGVIGNFTKKRIA